tara:strand:+ start:1079 stop:1513 length:435 start_codon:yes stop_codon:yes gene_type:complete
MKKILLFLVILSNVSLANAKDIRDIETMSCFDFIQGTEYFYSKAEGQYDAVVFRKSNPSNVLYLTNKIYTSDVEAEGHFQLLKFKARANRLPASLGADYWAQRTKRAELASLEVSSKVTELALILFDNEEGEDSAGNIALNCLK